MGSSPTGKSGKLEWDGGCPFVWNSDLLTGAASASRTSVVFVAPFDFKLRIAAFNITDSLAASTALPTLKRNGTAIATLTANGLATGLHDMLSGTLASGFATSDYLIRRGDELVFNIPNVASFAGQGVIAGNPL